MGVADCCLISLSSATLVQMHGRATESQRAGTRRATGVDGNGYGYIWDQAGLAIVNRNQGHYDEVERLYERALDRWEGEIRHCVS